MSGPAYEAFLQDLIKNYTGRKTLATLSNEQVADMASSFKH
jgi:hypothetical protein